ncbi:MAG: bifunctional acetate--CoA ligase family protein/GNAT family N-acetyltransferase [Gammaproteobacteria bacterium]|jgi:acetyltransferase
MRPHYLNPLFSPASIVVFGASDREDAVGQVVFRNLLQAGFKGAIHAVNPKRKVVQGQPCFPDLMSIGEPVDLAVVATPAKTVPAIVDACGEHGIRAMIILSAGFREIGAAGRQLEERVLEAARNYGIRILGPNCLGLIRPDRGVNATFGNNNARPGNLALVSQSGALCTAILDWAEQRRIGFSAVISTGIAADLDFGDILDYLVTDTRTDSILLYIEGLQDARRFMTGLRAAARVKPVIAIKVGRHGEGAKASMSHTGALVGGDEAFSAAMARSGVVRVQTISQLFAAANTLASRYRGCGTRLAIVTNGGGPGVFAADHVADLGLQLATLGEDTLQGLNKCLPATWSHGNPVDVIGDANPERYAGAVDLCLRDPGIDGVVVILTPQAMTRPLAVAEALIALADQHSKPVFTVWMGGDLVESARDAFREARIPTFTTPEAAVDAVHYLAAYQANQKLLLQVPPKSVSHQGEPDIDAARLIIEGALAEQRKVLSEPESIALLNAFMIPAARNGIARSPEEALVLATSIGFPVAMKVYSQDISHKSDAGGVLLNINTAQAVRSGFRDLLEQVKKNRPDANVEGVTVEKMYRSRNGRELMIGIISDPVFGPVISFGSGGTAVEIMQDSAVSLPPLNIRLAHDLISRTRVAGMLGEFRHMPRARVDALVDVLLRVSTMACELPWLQEMDINPLIVDEHGIIAVDARIRVDFPRASTDPYHHMAIHPYPAHLVTRYQLPDGTDITVRPIRPEDAELEQDFIRNLSEQSRYFRFMQSIHELTPQMLTRFTQIDYDQEMALLAVAEHDGQEEELAVGRYVTNSDGSSCEFALVVSDKWQRLGIGHRMMNLLIRIARDRGLESMEGEVLSSNTKMLGLLKSLDFHITDHADDGSIKTVSRAL